MILDDDYPAAMRLANGAKDARLVTEASREAGLHGRVIGASAELMARALELGGHEDEDMAAAYFAAIEPAGVVLEGAAVRDVRVSAVERHRSTSRRARLVTCPL